MRTNSLYSIAVLLALGATLLVPDEGARAALPTVDGPAVGRMHRVIIVDAGVTVPAGKPNSAKRPATPEYQAPVRSDPRPAPAPVPSTVDRTVQRGTQVASPLPVR